MSETDKGAARARSAGKNEAGGETGTQNMNGSMERVEQAWDLPLRELCDVRSIWGRAQKTEGKKFL